MIYIPLSAVFHSEGKITLMLLLGHILNRGTEN
uniref:Uncharacterized protein n=1 Tax=Anguilla anguilla TaxID=7936 RepID=A0A0E9TH14_ANGAN